MAAAAAARQIRFVDAPVTGSAPVATEGNLVFWVGAEDADFGNDSLIVALLWVTGLFM